jgi:hypothetical protein
LRKHLGGLQAPKGKSWQTQNIVVPGTPDPRVLKSVKPRPGFHVKAEGAVCEKCNNGWGSEIQNNAKDVMIPLIEDAPTDLTPTQRGALGAWAAMTGISLEYAHGDTVEEFRRRYVYTHHEPAPHTSVLLTRLHTVKMATAVGNSRLQRKQDKVVLIYHALFTARALGLLIFQGAFSPQQTKAMQGHSNVAIQVWPVVLLTNVSWPPREDVTVDDMVRIGHDILGA